MLAYLALSAVSMGIIYWQGRWDAVFGFSGWAPAFENALIGVMVAAGVIAVSTASRRWWGWAERLDREFAHLLGPLDARDALLLAVSSGLAEELFFRAALQPLLGLWVTSLLFGLLHYPMNRRMLPWPFLAGAMGVVLGGVYLHTGSLLAVALAHGLINYVALVEIARENPRR